MKSFSRDERLYIFGTEQSVEAAYSLANLENLAQLMESVQVTTAIRMRSQPSDSPIAKLISHHQASSNSPLKSTILGKCLNIGLATEAITQKDTLPLTWFKSYRYSNNHQQNLSKSSLVSYISIHSRVNGKKDSTLSIPSPTTRRIAIHWRLNTAPT